MNFTTKYAIWIGLWTMAIDEFTTKVSQRLSSMSAIECSSLQVGEIVDDLADVSPFTGLETRYLQSRYYAQHFHSLIIIMLTEANP